MHVIKNIRLWMSAMMVLCAAEVSAQTTGSTLTVADIEGAAGKEVSVPLYMSNADEVVGVQFDVELPYALTSDIVLSETRKDGHSVMYKRIDKNLYKYRVTVMSFSNKAIKGNSGLLMRLPMTVDEEAQADDTFPMLLTNIVLAKADGNNVATQTTYEGTFTVQRVPTPDLVVYDVTVSEANRTLTPGEALRVSYTVKNQGTAETGAGWKENVYLTDATGSRVFVGSVTYNSTLTVATALDRYIEITLPQVMRIEGEVTVYVEIVNIKKTGELIADQGNNGAASADVCTLTKRLFLTPDNVKIAEGSYQNYTLVRSGDWSMDETYTLSCEHDGILDFPEIVTIKAEKSGVSFRVTAIDDNEVNTLVKTYLNVVAAYGYEATRVGVLLADDDDYPLTITADKAQITEGDELTLTVKRGGPLDEELKVNISCNQPLRMTTLRTITIPAGETTASAIVSVRENLTPQADVTVAYTAQATDYETSKVEIPLIDGDRPHLTLKLSTDVVSEADGYGALMATVTRDGDLSENLNIFVDNSSDGEVYFDSDRYTISAGSSSVTFPIGVTDNSIIEGTRTYEVTAAIYLTDVKRADENTTMRETFEMTDNDVLHISLESNVAAILEGGMATVTVNHNDEGSSKALTVNLSADDNTVTIPTVVTIAAGKTSTTFEVKVSTNNITDDERTFTIKAESEYGEATLLFMISDRTQPDYTVKSTRIQAETLSPNREFTVEMEIENKGTAQLPAGYGIKVYLADRARYVKNIYWETKMAEIGTWVTSEAIAAGESKVMTFTATIPANFNYGEGYRYLKTWGNRKETVLEDDELSYTNNEPNGIEVDIVRPYIVTSISTDKQVYMPGDVATLKGMTAGGREGDIIEVYQYNDAGERFVVGIATMAIDATFELQYTIGANWGGLYKIGACGIGEYEYEALAEIGVYNLDVNGGARIEWKITEGESKEGTISVTNQSGIAIHNVQLVWENMPENCTMQLGGAVATLAAGATTNFTYKLTPTAASTGGKYLEGKMTATCDEGISKSVNTYYYCTKSYADVVFEKERIETTLMHGTARSYEVRLGNAGLVETGELTIETPTSTPWLGFSTPGTMTSLATGETASIMLTLAYQEDMIAGGTYESFVRVKPTNGKSVVLPVKVTVVSNEKATLTVDAVDVYTKSAENGDGPHVEGATVKLVNKMTGETAMTGTTGSDGLWTTTELLEGVYDLYVSADRHQTYKETITLGPGETMNIEAFLPYAVVKVSYTVEDTEVVDEYETRIEMVVVPDIPQAIVVPEGMSFGCGGTTTANVTLTNKGKLTAYNPYLLFPTIDGVTFTVLNEYPEVLYPGESYDMKVRFDGPENVTREMATTVVMHYEYKLHGEMYANNDGHVATWGCEDEPIFIGGGGFGGSDLDSGSNDMDEMFDNSIKDNDLGGDEEGLVSMPTYNPISNSKTHQVVLEFRQTFFLTRQAFRGTLKIENQFTTGITDIVFEANVETMDGTDVTELFALDYDEKPTGGIKVDDKTKVWSLEGEKSGEAGVIYVPSKETAPTEPVTYLFGGTLAYTDVATGDRVKVDLMQTALTVNPSPDLYLTYFIQREFISDDPLTDVVEPWEPAEFALLIQNKGAGKALNLAIETSEPKIIENVNGLPIAFKSLYSSINGVEGNFPFTYMEVGAIEPGQNVLARWFFYSNVSGYVNDYYAEMTRGSLYGEEFNLITLLGARDLKRSVKSVPQATANAVAARGVDVASRATADIFLLDEIEDAENLPDCVIDGNGNETTDVEIVNGTTTVNKVSDNIYKLNVEATRTGWVYGKLHDPTNGTMQLASVVRESDGADMGVNNFWQTDRSIAKDRSTIYENLLHFADYMYGVEETYTLTFVEKPAEPVIIMAIEGIPEVATTEPVTQVRVVFSKEIDATTFTADDIVITCNGTPLDLTKATITKAVGTSMTYVVDWSALTPMYGAHQLTVYTTGIVDADGQSGESSVMRSWTQNINGKALLSVEVTPSGAGTITGSGEHDFGYVTLKATSNKGYVFYRWKEDGKVLSTDANYTYLLYKPTTLIAEFVPETYMLTITCDEVQGCIEGVADGIYEYGTEMTLRAVANSGYTFSGWTINGDRQESSNAVLPLVIDKVTELIAWFDKTIIMLLMGDVNNDDKVTVTDISLMVSYIMKENPFNFVFAKGDMDDDGGISVTDITRIVQKILNGETTLTTATTAHIKGMAVPQWKAVDVVARLNEEVVIPVSLVAEGSYVAWQTDVVLPRGMELTDVRLDERLKRHSVSYAKIDENTYRIVVYSMKNTKIDVYENIMELLVRPVVSMADSQMVVAIENTRLVDTSLNGQSVPSATAKVEVEGTDVDNLCVGVAVEGGKELSITALQECVVTVYAVDGRIIRMIEVKEGIATVNLAPGIYVVCGKKVVIY